MLGTLILRMNRPTTTQIRRGCRCWTVPLEELTTRTLAESGRWFRRRQFQLVVSGYVKALHMWFKARSTAVQLTLFQLLRTASGASKT